MTGLECWATQYSFFALAFSEFKRALRDHYFSPDPSLGAFDPPGEGFASSAGASGDSILILVLSGNPYAPIVTTFSPSLSPSTTCTSSPFRMPSLTVC